MVSKTVVADLLPDVGALALSKYGRKVLLRAANSRGPGGPTEPLVCSPDRDCAIRNAPALVPGPLARLCDLRLLTALPPQVLLHILAPRDKKYFDPFTVRARPALLSALRVFHSKSLLYGGFVWARRARRALNRPKRRLPARAGGADAAHAGPGGGLGPGGRPHGADLQEGPRDPAEGAAEGGARYDVDNPPGSIIIAPLYMENQYGSRC